MLMKKVFQSNLLDPIDSGFIIYDLDFLTNKMVDLKNAFPGHWLHTSAIKACPLPNILSFVHKKFHLGAEAASIEEVKLAIDCQIPAHLIIYDAPIKTMSELEFALKNNIHINADSFEECDQIAEIIKFYPNARVGLRINPAVGSGKIQFTSVATKDSHFGVLLDGNENKIRDYFLKFPWLNGIHVHIGSQGMSLETLAQGVGVVFNFAQTLPGLKYFDMGGGLPVAYRPSDVVYSFHDYAILLKKHIPQLFETKLIIITEFGRSLYAQAAIAVSHVEFIKNPNYIACHFGADLFLRKIYKPLDWYHKLSVINSIGEEKKSPFKTYKISGPLCFSGDVLEKEIEIPEVEKNDFLIYHDVGAYTLSMWSRHCSRAIPKVIGVLEDKCFILKKRETREQLFQFWT